MAHWDTSALLKLFLAEDDSTVFCALAAEGNTPVTAFIARHELQAAFTRREGEGSLQRGEADRLYADFLQDLSRGDTREIPAGGMLEAEYAKVLRQCLFDSPQVFVRTNGGRAAPSFRTTSGRTRICFSRSPSARERRPLGVQGAPMKQALPAPNKRLAVHRSTTPRGS